MTTSQSLAMLNKQLTKEQLKNIELSTRVEELEGQYAYECECNKQFVETQNKCERLDTLLNNVCAYLAELLHQDDLTAEHSYVCFGMTEEEHKKYIMGE